MRDEPQMTPRSRLIRGAVLAALPCVTLMLFVEPGRGFETGDGAAYQSMVAGQRADPPFSRRLAVPALVRGLAAVFGAEPTVVFRSVSLAAAALSVLALFGWLVHLGISAPTAALAVALSTANVGVAFLVRNPWLVDGGYLAVQQTALVLFSFGQAVPFAVVAILALFVRENAAPLALLPLAGDLLAGQRPARTRLAVPIVAGALLVSLVWWKGSASFTQTKPALQVLGDGLGVWHALWLFVATAALRARKEPAVVSGVLLVVALPAMAACLIATDTTRLLFLACPAVALCVARGTEAMPRWGRAACWLAVPTLVVGAAHGHPSVFGVAATAVRQPCLAVGGALVFVGWLSALRGWWARSGPGAGPACMATR